MKDYRLPWTVLALVASGAWIHPSRGEVFLNETFDGEPPILFTWMAVSTANDSWALADGVGVNGSRGVTASADFAGGGIFSGLGFYYYNGDVSGNASTNPADYQLSFDLRVNQPNVTKINLAIQCYSGAWTTGDSTVAMLEIPLSIPAGSFQTISVNLADPSIQPHRGDLDPSGRTYLIGFEIDSNGWSGTTGFNFVVDNIALAVVPEPSSSLWLAGFGAALGWNPVRRRLQIQSWFRR